MGLVRCGPDLFNRDADCGGSGGDAESRRSTAGRSGQLEPAAAGRDGHRPGGLGQPMRLRRHPVAAGVSLHPAPIARPHPGVGLRIHRHDFPGLLRHRAGDITGRTLLGRSTFRRPGRLLAADRPGGNQPDRIFLPGFPDQAAHAPFCRPAHQ